MEGKEGAGTVKKPELGVYPAPAVGFSITEDSKERMMDSCTHV